MSVERRPTAFACPRIHAGRVVGRDRDYRRAGRPALARHPSRPRSGPPRRSARTISSKSASRFSTTRVARSSPVRQFDWRLRQRTPLYAGWTIEILPFAENQALKNLYVTGAVMDSRNDPKIKQLRETPVSMYTCPSDMPMELTQPQGGCGTWTSASQTGCSAVWWWPGSIGRTRAAEMAPSRGI